MKDFTVLNQKRVKCLWFIVFAIMSAIIGGIMYINLPPIGIVFFIIAAILFMIGIVSYSKLQNEFKNKYLRELINEIIPNSQYNPKQGVSEHQVYECRFLKRADRYSANDLITGEIEDVKFVNCDIKLEERHVQHTKNGTRVYYVTYFLGRFFEFEFPKEFKGQILVTEWRLPTLFSNLKKVELESIDFNKRFKTYTNNEYNAFYVLTPHLMESIMDLERSHPGDIGISFMGNRLNIAIKNNRDTFTLNLLRKFDESIITEWKRDLLVIKDIVDELKLNRDIFK